MCEVQFVLKEMFFVRHKDDLNGHGAYSRTRNAVELLEQSHSNHIAIT